MSVSRFLQVQLEEGHKETISYFRALLNTLILCLNYMSILINGIIQEICYANVVGRAPLEVNEMRFFKS